MDMVPMDETIRSKVVELLRQHPTMTLATVRPDGWPQATTVGYVNHGVTLYFTCPKKCQKAENLAQDDRVSMTIDRYGSDPMQIAGLSIAGHAQPVNSLVDECKFYMRFVMKYPEFIARRIDAPDQFKSMRVFRVTPKVICLIDYTKGFGRSSLVVP